MVNYVQYSIDFLLLTFLLEEISYKVELLELSDEDVVSVPGTEIRCEENLIKSTPLTSNSQAQKIYIDKSYDKAKNTASCIQGKVRLRVVE